MKPEVKYPKKSTWGRISDKYYPIFKSILRKHINSDWKSCFSIIKKHIPEKYMFVAKNWFPDKVNRNGDLHTGWGIVSKSRLTRPFMYSIIYIDEDNIIRETPKAKVFTSKNLAYIKVKEPNYWDPKYKIDFEITTNSCNYVSLLKYWQSDLLKPRVALDLEGNPKGILLDWMYSITMIPIKAFIEFCEKNRYTYRIIERGTYSWGTTYHLKYHYKPFYEE